MEDKSNKEVLVLIITIIILASLLIASIFHCMSATDEAYSDGFGSGVDYAYDVTPTYYEPSELDPFLEHASYRVIYVLDVEPVIKVNLPDVGFESVIYNISFYSLNREEINQSVEIWSQNHSKTIKYMTFKSAFGNNQIPIAEKTLVDLHYLRLTKNYYSVIYYEQII